MTQAVNLMLLFVDGEFTQSQIDSLIWILRQMDNLGIDYSGLLEWADPFLPMSVRNALHNAGLASYPIWERNVFFNILFYWVLFGWIWM